MIIKWNPFRAAINSILYTVRIPLGNQATRSHNEMQTTLCVHVNSSSVCAVYAEKCQIIAAIAHLYSPNLAEKECKEWDGRSYAKTKLSLARNSCCSTIQMHDNKISQFFSPNSVLKWRKLHKKRRLFIFNKSRSLELPKFSHICSWWMMVLLVCVSVWLCNGGGGGWFLFSYYLCCPWM